MNLTTESWKNRTYDDEELSVETEFPFYILVGLVASIGLVGNLLILVITYHKDLSRHSFSIYLRVTAISDTMVLLLTSTEDILDSDELELLDALHQISFPFCKAWSVFYVLFRTISPWMVVALSLDRCVAVWRPLHRSRYCCKKVAALVSLLVVGIALVGNLALLWEVLIHQERPNITLCYEGIEIDAGIYFSLATHSALPCVFLLVLNIMVVVRIKRSMKFRRTFSTTVRENNGKGLRATIPLVFVSLLAFLTLLPLTLTELIESFQMALYAENYEVSGQKAKVDKAWSICNIIYLVNFAQNFYILMCSSSHYRQIFRDIFCKFRFHIERPRSAYEAATCHTETIHM